MTGPEYYNLCAQRSAIRLEAIGLKHSSGRSVLAHCKRVYGIKGSREKVLARMDEMIAEALADRAKEVEEARRNGTPVPDNGLILE